MAEQLILKGTLEGHVSPLSLSGLEPCMAPRPSAAASLWDARKN